ncbi:MAG: hypothetical protein QNJ47_05705 [Nostocaceae cyanobacterium]|nr:hypothetical protein [Nostocaceae cyanobacterium]
MSEIPVCRIVISSQIPPDEIESLETSLGMNKVKVQKSTNRVLGVDDLLVVATVVSGAAATAQLIDYSIKVAKAINHWRRKLREKGIEPKGELVNPKKSLSLDLSTATDEEVEEWLSQK